MSFDPKTNMKMIPKELNWIVMLIFSYLIFYTINIKISRSTKMLKMVYNFISTQFEIVLKKKKDGSKLLPLILYMFVGFSNLIGLVPNKFTTTSHITTNLFMSLPMWLGFMMFGWFKFTNKMFSHLVPMGTPKILISFMILIETISNLIRPFTISIRLMANMVAGHLLLTLMGNLMKMKPIMVFLILALIQTSLTSLEMAVAMIQAYVFCMLLILYSDESDYLK